MYIMSVAIIYSFKWFRHKFPCFVVSVGTGTHSTSIQVDPICITEPACGADKGKSVRILTLCVSCINISHLRLGYTTGVGKYGSIDNILLPYICESMMVYDGQCSCIYFSNV